MIRVTNTEELKQVLQKLERMGYVWISGCKPMHLYEAQCENVKSGEIGIERHIGYDPDRRCETRTLTWKELQQVDDFLMEEE